MKLSKLTMAAIQLSVALMMIVTITFAWVTASVAPEISGIQMSIGGSSTISIAPDVTQTVEGQTYHYPGEFGDSIQISDYEGYQYIQDLDALVPVSTADGVNWFLPTYYDPTDQEVQDGLVSSGDLKPYDQFYQDSTLQYANHANLPDYDTLKGNYAYIDFWVVAPMDYDLRISMERVDGNDDSRYSGSYAIALPQAEYVVDETGETSYVLTETPQSTAALRMGFLTNTSSNTEAYELYKNSSAYNTLYTQLNGIYPESGYEYYYDSSFTIYEPNGTFHPTEAQQQALMEETGGMIANLSWETVEPGSYVETQPIGLVDGQVTPVDISDRLMIQTDSIWVDMDLFQSLFTNSVDGNPNGLTLDELESNFYTEHLQGAYGNYVIKGDFVQSTAALYEALYESATEGSISSEAFSEVTLSGATDDVIIVSLQKNVPQCIRLYIWVEGQDIDCTNSVVASKIALSVELAGSNQDFEE